MYITVSIGNVPSMFFTIYEGESNECCSSGPPFLYKSGSEYTLMHTAAAGYVIILIKSNIFIITCMLCIYADEYTHTPASIIYRPRRFSAGTERAYNKAGTYFEYYQQAVVYPPLNVNANKTPLANIL